MDAKQLQADLDAARSDLEASRDKVTAAVEAQQQATTAMLTAIAEMHAASERASVARNALSAHRVAEQKAIADAALEARAEQHRQIQAAKAGTIGSSER